MSRDHPIIARVREARRKISAENGHDVRRLGEHYRELERTVYADVHYVGKGASKIRRPPLKSRG